MTVSFSSHSADQLQDFVSNVLGWNVILQPERSISGSLEFRSGHTLKAVRSVYSEHIRCRSPGGPPRLAIMRMRQGAVSAYAGSKAVTFEPGQTMILNSTHIDALGFIGYSDTDYISVSLPDLVSAAERICGTPEGLASLQPILGVGRDSADGKLLDLLLDTFVHAISTNESVVSRFSINLIEESVLSVLLNIIATPRDTHWGDNTQSTSAILQRAVECIEQTAGPLLVTDLAAAVGVSVRTLQMTFQIEFGVSPGRYLREIRLGRFRKAMLTEPGGDFAARAAAWGFSNISRLRQQFVSRYGLSEWRAIRSGDKGRP